MDLARGARQKGIRGESGQNTRVSVDQMWLALWVLPFWIKTPASTPLPSSLPPPPPTKRTKRSSTLSSWNSQTNVLFICITSLLYYLTMNIDHLRKSCTWIAAVLACPCPVSLCSVEVGVYNYIIYKIYALFSPKIPLKWLIGICLNYLKLWSIYIGENICQRQTASDFWWWLICREVLQNVSEKLIELFVQTGTILMLYSCRKRWCQKLIMLYISIIISVCTTFSSSSVLLCSAQSVSAQELRNTTFKNKYIYI